MLVEGKEGRKGREERKGRRKKGRIASSSLDLPPDMLRTLGSGIFRKILSRLWIVSKMTNQVKNGNKKRFAIKTKQKKRNQ
jgi:hypothetical protein